LAFAGTIKTVFRLSAESQGARSRDVAIKRLAQTLGTLDYFVVGFGAMIGVGWLVVMDDWLQRGGPIGAMLGFFLGASLLLPVGYVYSRLVIAIPDAGGEAAYASRVFNRRVSFLSGWMMVLAYFVVCPWEGVAIGSVCSYIFPQLTSFQLYSVAGQPVFLPQLVIGVALTAVLTWINYWGVRMSATFQRITTFGLLGLFAVFAGGGLLHGKSENLSHGFSHAPWLSILLVLQIVPYFMTGFESVGKCAEESSPKFQSHNFYRAIMGSLVVGGVFYCLIIFVVGYAYPWQRLITHSFATAYALQQVVAGQWIVNLVLVAALFALLKCFNANFLATSRLIFAMGRRGMLDERLAAIDPDRKTPATAVVLTGVLTMLGVFLGKAILIPITEVGGLASACGWFISCLVLYRIDQAFWPRAVAIAGAAVSLGLISMKVLPMVPGHFSSWEWISLALWLALGFAVKQKNRQEPVSETSSAGM
jgi:basic amino acid/polyamine antiporter, APA family